LPTAFDRDSFLCYAVLLSNFCQPITKRRRNHDKEKRSFYLNAVWPLATVGMCRSEYRRQHSWTRWFGRRFLVGSLERYHCAFRVHRVALLEQHPLLRSTQQRWMVQLRFRAWRWHTVWRQRQGLITKVSSTSCFTLVSFSCEGFLLAKNYKKAQYKMKKLCGFFSFVEPDIRRCIIQNF